MVDHESLASTGFGCLLALIALTGVLVAVAAQLRWISLASLT
jgi:hypothetical protein